MKQYCILIVIILSLFNSFAQGTSNQACSLTLPSITSCKQLSNLTNLTSAGTSNLNSGTYYFSANGTQSFPANYSLNGATLILCGGTINNLNNLNFNNGVIIIASGTIVNHSQSLHINGSTGTIYNMGTLNINQNLVVQANGLYNDNGALISTKNLEVNSKLRNLGEIIVADRIDIRGNGFICAGNGSLITTKHAYNDSQNAIAVPSGYSCFSYSSTLGGNNSITATSNLYICRQTGASTPVNNAAGQATVINNCTNCAQPLSIELLSFELSTAAVGKISFDFTIRADRNVRAIVLEHATSTCEFKEIFISKYTENQIGESLFNFDHTDYRSGINYYRLVIIRDDGAREILTTRSIKIASTQDFHVYPNPAVAGEIITIQHEVNTDDRAEVEIYSIVGNRIATYPLEKGRLFHTMDLPKGQFIMKFISNGEHLMTVPLVVN